MEESYQQFASAFAQKIIDREYAAAHQMLAPWLQLELTPARLQQFVETELQEVAAIANLDAILHPKEYSIDGNSCSLADLKEDRTYITSRRSNESIPLAVTDENFRKWLVIQFMPALEEEIDVDAWFDWWLLLVEVEGRYGIGYFEIEDPD